MAAGTALWGALSRRWSQGGHVAVRVVPCGLRKRCEGLRKGVVQATTCTLCHRSASARTLVYGSQRSRVVGCDLHVSPAAGGRGSSLRHTARRASPPSSSGAGSWGNSRSTAVGGHAGQQGGQCKSSWRNVLERRAEQQQGPAPQGLMGPGRPLHPTLRGGSPGTVVAAADASFQSLQFLRGGRAGGLMGRAEVRQQTAHREQFLYRRMRTRTEGRGAGLRPAPSAQQLPLPKRAVQAGWGVRIPRGPEAR